MKLKKREILSWNINIEWSDGKRENIGDIPDDVAGVIDDFLTELESEK